MSVIIRPCHPISNSNNENDDETCSPKDWPNIDFLEQILGQELQEDEPQPELAAASRNTTENYPTRLSPTNTANATTTTTATSKNTQLILNGASLQASARWALMKKLLVSATNDKDKEEDWVQRLLFFSQLDQCHIVGPSDDTRSTDTAAATFVFDPPKRHERQWTESEIQTIQKAWNHWAVERNHLSTIGGTSSSSSKNHTPTTSDLYELWPKEEEESNSATSPSTSSMDHQQHQRRSVLHSNQRPLQWNVMDCPPACKFQLHAHPNLELIFCVQGELHEVRMMGPPLPREAMIPISSTTTATATATTTDQEDENHSASHTTPVLQVSPLHYKWNQKSSSSTTSSSGNNNDNDQIRASSSSPLGQPSQSATPRQKRPPWKFSTLSTGSWLVNEVGSVHQSFTATSGTGCKLLVLWGGSHANVPRGEEPSFVQQAVEQMDQVITNKYTSTSSSCVCGGAGSDNGGWERLEETFLPASERQILSNERFS
jgi:hypothetical protein